MLRPRIIPCLLIQNGGLVKTVNFRDPKYVGDPINAVRIFNEKVVDELVVLAIDSTVKEVEPDFQLIAHLAAECRMPLCYGGGIKNSAQVERIISLGVEKVAISSAAVLNPGLIAESSAKVGSQSIVVVLDALRDKKGGYELVIKNGTQKTGLNPVDFAKQAAQMGAGEIVINSIDKDGSMSGYDLELIKAIYENVKIPVTALGGAGSLADISHLIHQFGIIGVAAGSIFVFKGKYRAVLINYPAPNEKENLY